VIPVEPRDTPADHDQESEQEQTYAVRPYAVVGGRTKASSAVQHPVETLVQSVGDATEVGLTPERRKILELSAQSYISIAELSAHIHLPVGVMRILITDLADEGKVRIHAPASASSDPATSLSVLESVLNGISAL
jgi:hypothetical protein